MGGLVTITDLALVLAERRSGVTDGSLDTISLVVSALLYSVAGAAVARETGRVTFGALAGLLAGALDGIVLGAAHAATEPFGPQPGVSAQQMWAELVGLNVLLGGSLAWASAWFGSLSRRASSNRGGRGGGTSRGDDVDKKPNP
jgi:hypothetical protein